jgi:hypothetical protein
MGIEMDFETIAERSGLPVDEPFSGVSTEQS